jgi:hypothetical protein
MFAEQECQMIYKNTPIYIPGNNSEIHIISKNRWKKQVQLLNKKGHPNGVPASLFFAFFRNVDFFRNQSITLVIQKPIGCLFV